MSEPGVTIIRGWVRKHPNILELSNPHTVAALLCRSWYWGNTPQERVAMKRGEAFEYKPSELVYVKNRFSPERRQLCVVFGLRGDPDALLLRRDLFLNAQIYVAPQDWKKKKALLDPLVAEAENEANKRLASLIKTGAIT